MNRFLPQCLLLVLTACTQFTLALAQQPKRDLIVSTIDNNNIEVVSGNVRPEVRMALDKGPRAGSAPLSGTLLLKRSPKLQAAFEEFLQDLGKRGSPSYHQWLTNAEIGRRFGPSEADLSCVSRWLADEGFTVHPVSPDATTISFDGSVALAEQAFHTSIHNLDVNGEAHFANVTDPQLPMALSSVVAGVVSLSDFVAKAKPIPAVTPPAHSEGAKGMPGKNYISAADLATIYNFNPLFARGITGKGVTLALLEPYDQYNVGDWQIFRKVFGLSRAYPYGTLTNVNPTGSNPCTVPGPSSDPSEAADDVDWATAAAPNATLLSAACATSGGIVGSLLAFQNLLQSPGYPRVVSISHGETESSLGATYQAYIASLYAVASMQGVSIFVSAGDMGASPVHGAALDSTGIHVNGYASTPYNTAVGGTDSGIVALHARGDYFSISNLPNFRTALSYIPEIPWNHSCASQLLASYLGYPTVGPNSLCNSGLDITTGAGSGGPSGCATGSPAIAGVVSGTCQGYRKPAWQSLVGVPADGVRDLPDVSMFASNNVWGLVFAVCDSQAAPCTADPSQWFMTGGTSLSAPIWAGIQALVNQATGGAWGLPNTSLYPLARTAYGSSGAADCNASLGNAVSSNCIFHDITQGDNAVDCVGDINCYVAGGLYGVLSTSSTKLSPAYQSTVGYDLTTGIGTPNVTNLVDAWVKTFPTPPHIN